MRQALRLGVVLLALSVGCISVAGCRRKFKRGPTSQSRAPSALAAASDAGTQRINEANFGEKPVELAEYAKIRRQVLAAIEAAIQSAPSDSLVPLVQAWEQAPQSAVLAIELARAAARASDERKLQTFRQLAAPLVIDEPHLAKMLDGIGSSKAFSPRLAPPGKAPAAPMVIGTARRIDGISDLKSICSWLGKSFAEGKPPVTNVGPQGTEGFECQTLASYDVTAQLQALPVVAAVRGHGQRAFGWVAAKWKDVVWLSPVLVESFSPPFHPYGNGFSVELQRVAVYRDGLPELSAYVTERRTVIDPALNERQVVERHELVILTFDVDPPQVSAPVVLHSRLERSLVDATDRSLPKGYRNSPDIGKVSEQTFKLKWGDNRAVLTPSEPKDAKPVEQVLFSEQPIPH